MKSRLEPAVEQIVSATIEQHFLTRQQLTIQSTTAEVARRRREEQLSVPKPYTVRAGIVALQGRAAIVAVENGTERITMASLGHCGYVSQSERRRAAIAA